MSILELIVLNFETIVYLHEYQHFNFSFPLTLN